MFFPQFRKTFDDILEASITDYSVTGTKHTLADERCSDTPICPSCQ